MSKARYKKQVLPILMIEESKFGSVLKRSLKKHCQILMTSFP
jgi:hypothetical protein